jgi:hypothetical protein
MKETAFSDGRGNDRFLWSTIIETPPVQNRWRPGPTAIAGLLLGLGAAGCRGPAEPPPPPGGGREFLLDFALFSETVAPVLSRRGCDEGGDCHGDGIRGTFALSPVDTKDVAFDFEQASMQVDPYDQLGSPLLEKPLAVAAGGQPHSYQPFASTDDPDYQAIRDWIVRGEFR